MYRGHKEINILLVEDNPGDVRLIYEIAKESSKANWKITNVTRLEQAREYIKEHSFDVILLDLGLPDSTGFETFMQIRDDLDEIPVILLTGLDDEDIAIRAVQEGAQDYLNKSEITDGILIRSIRYAIERQNLLKKLREKSVIDELTGLYNRRGFFNLADKAIKMADRTQNPFIIVFVDLDGLKWINDNLGHHEGDNAIIDTANVFKKVFRETDIIARIGGDEFVIIALDTSDGNMDVIERRIKENVASHNEINDRLYKLSISIGLDSYDPGSNMTLDEIMKSADQRMYEEKQKKKLKSDYIENIRR